MLEAFGQLPPLSEVSQAVLVRLLTRGPASRAELARALTLSAPTLTRIVRVLEDDGLVIPGDWGSEVTPRLGRPSQSLDVNADAVHLLGIKLTASEMTVVRTDMFSEILDQEALPLDDTAVEAVADLVVTTVRRHLGLDPLVGTVGISLAGPVTARSDVVHRSPFLGWTNAPLRQLVEQRLPIPVVVDNDVRALTASTHWFGAAAGCSNFALVTVGAGVACGVVVDGHLVTGASGAAGQIGHLPISESGPVCESGHRGCARAYLSTQAMIAHAAIGLADPGVDYGELLRLAAAQNPVARRIVEDAGYALGTVIGTLATLCGPEKVIVTGEGAGFVPLAADLVNRRAREVEHWTVDHVPIQVAPFGFTEWARGAAVVALQCLVRGGGRSGAPDPTPTTTPIPSRQVRRSRHTPWADLSRASRPDTAPTGDTDRAPQLRGVPSVTGTTA